MVDACRLAGRVHLASTSGSRVKKPKKGSCEPGPEFVLALPNLEFLSTTPVKRSARLGATTELTKRKRKINACHDVKAVDLLPVDQHYRFKRKCKRLKNVISLSQADTMSGDGHQANGSSRNCGSRRKVIDAFPNKVDQKHAKVQKTAKAKTPRAVATETLPIDRLQLSSPTFCGKCNAKKFCYETENFCCCGGEVRLVMNGFPAELTDLYIRDDELGEHFRQYSRMYNNLFAYSSLGGDIDAGAEKGVYVFKLHGQIYHFVPELLPGEGKPKYLQLYFYDGQFEALQRFQTFKEVKQTVVEILMRVTSVNPYARFFRSLREIQVHENTQIMLNCNPGLDQRVYNKPAADDVAVIWPDNVSSTDCATPHVLIRGKAGDTHRIYHNYGCYDPLQYPLLFPYGECGWRQGIKKHTPANVLSATAVDGRTDPIDSFAVFLHEEHQRARRQNTRADKFVSPREYYAYKLQIRVGNMLLLTNRTLLQFVVDMYVKTENTRLDYVRNNQDTIRADLYQGILDSYESGVRNARNIGHRIILSASFIGGPRDLRRRYLNAMALVQRYGKPDFFVTMTCNTKWPEIQAELLAHQDADDRPDLVARIFRAKLLALRKKIMKEHVLGEVAAMIYVVEFQKRGLPHVHFLIILEAASKVKEPAHYDKFVCAELPHTNNVLLRKSVLAHMMHGPCGRLRPDSPCIRAVNGKRSCKNNYPKTFIDETTINDDGYPIYRRRPTGETVIIRGSDLDNRWVVPYNPYLLTLFDCHLNVEVCSTIKAVKYLYKYVYKGHDRVQFSVGVQKSEPMDEIEQFQSGRWVSSCEAAWRLFGFDLFDMHPPVLPLPVHLPNAQTVQLHAHEQIASVIRDSKRSRTALTEFFAFNRANQGKHNYLYSEFTEHYRWDPSAKEWFERQDKRICIGRLAFVLPAEGERFFLRLLLMHVRAPTSYADLRTVNGCVYPTFQEAALQLGLLEDDDVADKCLVEASTVQMPAALRRLFAIVLMFCQACDPLSLWEKHYSSLSEDYQRLNPNDPSKVKNLTVAALEEHLQSMGKCLKSFNLEELQTAVPLDFRITKNIADALNETIPLEFLAYKDMLNEKQKAAFSCVMDHVVGKKPDAFFIDGPGGTGKTFLYNALFAEVRTMNRIVLPTATSGIAASNLPNGRTTHSRFKIPVDNDMSLACDVPKQSSLAALIKEATLIIWDEASMANKCNIESLDLLLQDLCENKTPFGGKLVLFGGDFKQVLPVVPRKTQKEAVSASIVSSYLWNGLSKIHLTENQRACEDPSYSDFLLAMGDGLLQQQENDYVVLPEHLIHHISAESDPIAELIDHTFPEIAQGCVTSASFSKKTILCPLNIDVDSINSHVINCFPGESVTYKSFDVVLTDHCSIYPIEFINTLNPGGMSPHELVLKPGCPVMLIRNLLPSAGLCNGTRLVCKSFSRNVIECVISVGQYTGRHVFIPRINLRPPTSHTYPFQFQRKQFPLKLSFAMTINKSQGQTLDRVSIYLSKLCFAHGQLYVALSRARCAANITLFCSAPPLERHPHSVKNVVSYEVLDLAGIR